LLKTALSKPALATFLEEMKKKLLKERKMREKFQELLVELRQRDIIILKTKWKDISPLICKEDRFNDLLTQSGPTPIDFFKFFMIDWNSEFKNNLDFVLKIMDNEHFDFELSTTYESFTAFIEHNSKSFQVNKENYQYIYDSLLRDLIERTSKYDNAAEKLRQTVVAQFKKLETNPDVNIRDVEAVSRYFKARWNINENVEAIVLKLREEYLGQEEGEVTSDKQKNEKLQNSDSSRTSSPLSTKKKSKKEKKTRKRHHSSDREYNKKKKHRRHRSSSEEDDRRHRESSPNYRSHKSSRKY
jgi:pre-mRNA-processing factor 40